jgi:hypothetical protein
MKIDVDFEIFGILAFYSAILLGKMLLMSALTSRARIQKKVFANPEDKVFARGVEVSIKHTDQDVERIRRYVNYLCHDIRVLFGKMMYMNSFIEPT